MKSEYWASHLRPKSARILAITLASILLLSALCLMNGFSKTAYAAEKTDTVTGKITMTLIPSDNLNPPAPGTTDESLEVLLLVQTLNPLEGVTEKQQGLKLVKQVIRAM